jgi:hypothetical protein
LELGRKIAIRNNFYEFSGASAPVMNLKGWTILNWHLSLNKIDKEIGAFYNRKRGAG